MTDFTSHGHHGDGSGLMVEEFCVRTSCDDAGLRLVEFRGDPWSDDFPPVLHILEKGFPGLSITPLDHHDPVIDEVAAVLERSGAFRRVVWWCA